MDPNGPRRARRLPMPGTYLTVRSLRIVALRGSPDRDCGRVIPFNGEAGPGQDRGEWPGDNHQPMCRQPGGRASAQRQLLARGAPITVS